MFVSNIKSQRDKHLYKKVLIDFKIFYRAIGANYHYNKIMNFTLAGYKTYIVGALMIALGVLQHDNQMILTGIGFITTRTAISKVGFAVTGKHI